MGTQNKIKIKRYVNHVGKRTRLIGPCVLGQTNKKANRDPPLWDTHGSQRNSSHIIGFPADSIRTISKPCLISQTIPESPNLHFIKALASLLIGGIVGKPCLTNSPSISMSS